MLFWLHYSRSSSYEHAKAGGERFFFPSFATTVSLSLSLPKTQNPTQPIPMSYQDEKTEGTSPTGGSLVAAQPPYSFDVIK